MARHEGKFEAAAETSLDIRDLVRALGRSESDLQRERQAAMACLLSASEGWREAVEQLGGAFAEDGEGTGLTGGKES